MAKRSQSVQIGFVSWVAAAALAGCDGMHSYHRDWQECVDQHNVVVEDRLCDESQRAIAPYYYHWLYSPRPFFLGSSVIGGYLAPGPSMDVARASSASSADVSRGGFGSSASGTGGGA
jgi:hypothetical protein